MTEKNAVKEKAEKAPKVPKEPKPTAAKKPNKFQSRPHYINNVEFTQVIRECKAAGRLSNRAVELFTILAERAVVKMKLINALDREDYIQSALFDMACYWNSFDETRSNAFAYFTQVVKNAYAKEYKRIYKHIKSKDENGEEKQERVEFISLSLSGDSEIYSM